MVLGTMCAAIISVGFSVVTYANIDYPFTVEEGVSKLDDLFKKLYDDGDLSELYTMPDKAAGVDEENHTYLYAAKGNKGGILIITFGENEKTHNVKDVEYSGGISASDEYKSEMYPVGALLADPTLSYEKAGEVVGQILDEETGRFDSGNLEYEIEKGYLFKVSILNEPSEESENDSTIEENATMGETQALKKALQYLEVSAFSHQGLIDQLMYDKFSEDEAKYAADKCGADWDEQALRKAKEYLEISAFSRDGLIEQLQYDGFTFFEASSAAVNLGYTY